jgi:hypothetical protein
VLGPENVATVEKIKLIAGPRITGSLEATERAVPRAEASGSILEAEPELGERVDPSTMRLGAKVPSEHLPLLENGTPVEFEVRGFPGERFSGSIARISPAADRRST